MDPSPPQTPQVPCDRLRQASAVALAVMCLLATIPALAVEPGDPAPDFSAPALDGSADVELAAYRGKVVYLDFWASWCAPCLQSLPKLESLQRELGEEDFQVLAVNVDQDPNQARRLLVKLGIGYPSASDPTGELPALYELPTMPTSYLIDADGVVRYVHKGFREGDLDQLRPRIESLIALPASPR